MRNILRGRWQSQSQSQQQRSNGSVTDDDTAATSPRSAGEGCGGSGGNGGSPVTGFPLSPLGLAPDRTGIARRAAGSSGGGGSGNASAAAAACLPPQSPSTVARQGECSGPLYDPQYCTLRGRGGANRVVTAAAATQSASSSEAPDSDEAGFSAAEAASPAYRLFATCIGTRDTERLRELAWAGCPTRLRAGCWQAFYSYPREDRRKKYRTYVGHCRDQEGCGVGGAGSLSSSAAADDRSSPSAMLRMIQKDVPRTQQRLPLLRMASIQACLEQVMLVWVSRNPATGYVQGMTDLATPFFVAFLASTVPQGALLCNDREEECCRRVGALERPALLDLEADVYWGFNHLLSSIQDHFTYGQEGIQEKLAVLDDLMRQAEPALHAHLEEAGLRLVEYAYKWMTCLLVRELPLRLVLRLWDAYFAEGVQEYPMMHVYVCLALLRRVSPALLQMTDFGDLLRTLQAPPTEGFGDTDLTEILSSAYQLQQLFPLHAAEEVRVQA